MTEFRAVEVKGEDCAKLQFRADKRSKWQDCEMDFDNLEWIAEQLNGITQLQT